jgi:hypothetical protein
MTDHVAINDLKSRAGLLLYRELPEEHRYRDTLGQDAAGAGRLPSGDKELGDLEAFLHGFGALLDLVRGTTEQAYADAFAESVTVSDFYSTQLDGNEREIQTWLLPYMAELVGAELLSPDPERRRDELDDSVTWFKSKGTLLNIDSVADTVSGLETVPVEGWRLTLTTPNPKLPPFTAPASAAGNGDPLGPPAHPLGTPDARRCNRAVIDPGGASPLFRIVTAVRDPQGRLTDAPDVVYWKPLARKGVPCFPNGYDDVSARTPDLRDPNRMPVGPNPRRVIVYVRPPYGLFEPGLKSVALPAGPNPLGFDLEATSTQVFDPTRVLTTIGQALDPMPDKIVITGDLTIPAKLHVEFEDVLFLGTVTIAAGAQLTLRSCAAKNVVLPPPGTDPSLIARDCLFDSLSGVPGFARLVCSTVMSTTTVERLQASDCIFVGTLKSIDCKNDQSCLRFSRLPDKSVLKDCCFEKNPSNTTDPPNFVHLYFTDGNKCVLRAAEFGEPGCGVLDLTTPDTVKAGAEDSGEMGAFNHPYLCARVRALVKKLGDFLPFGQEIVVRYDPMLARKPAALKP